MEKRRVIVVTGASGGIGYYIAKGYALKDFQVIAVDEKVRSFDNKNIEFCKVNLKNEIEIQNLFLYIKEKYGAVHILINNAAISHFSKSIYDIEISEFDSVIDVNLRAAFICCKEFVYSNKGENYGRIINIASTRWNQNEADWEAYGASKGGLISLTNTLTISLSNTPITVNAITPGWIETNDYNLLTKNDHIQHPSRRVGKPSDIVNACLFLSEENNDFINGANIVIDGGMTKKMIYE
ncbi:MAG: SDR family NAD(P)-dependent oxidoreductase [Sarcina sp.]